MKIKLLAAAAMATPAFALTPAPASAWTCGARSATGSWGIGQSASLYRAKRIALAHCAVNTPQGYWCFVTACG